MVINVGYDLARVLRFVEQNLYHTRVVSYHRVHQRREFVVIDEAVGVSPRSHQGFNLLYIPVMGGVE